MERLTTDKSIENMDMVELAHNCCYAKDKKAMYQDRAFNTDARSFARHVMKLQAGIELPLDDEEFDERMLDFLWYDPATSVVGTVALLYRNLWAMTDLRETLKDYEDAEEQGLLLRFKCKVGDTVYHIMGGNQIDSFEVMAIEIGEDGVKYFIENNRSAMWRSEKWFGKAVFLTYEAAESALAEKGGAE